MGALALAASGRRPSALEIAAEFGPEVVLLDIGPPGMDGYEVARQPRAERAARGIVLLALTGYGQEEDRRRARDAGFDHPLVKPIGPDAILALFGPTPPSFGSSRPPGRRSGN
jgi:CheY-like chemotaxis protein